jgi:hypothetical protein
MKIIDILALDITYQIQNLKHFARIIQWEGHGYYVSMGWNENFELLGYSPYQSIYLLNNAKFAGQSEYPVKSYAFKTKEQAEKILNKNFRNLRIL